MEHINIGVNDMNHDKGNDAVWTPSTNDVRLHDKLKDPGNLLIGLFVLNALVYMVIGFFVGGWALAGNVVDGHHYLYTGSKNSHTLVSQSVYTYSLWHGYSHSLLLLLLILFQPKRENKILR